MGHHTEGFVGTDTSKSRNVVAIAEDSRGGEVRYLGEFAATEAATRKLMAKLAAKYGQVTFCYEAGPTGYGLYRLLKSLGHRALGKGHPRGGARVVPCSSRHSRAGHAWHRSHCGRWGSGLDRRPLPLSKSARADELSGSRALRKLDR